jgi:hypothetical protein
MHPRLSILTLRGALLLLTLGACTQVNSPIAPLAATAAPVAKPSVPAAKPAVPVADRPTSSTPTSSTPAVSAKPAPVASDETRTSQPSRSDQGDHSRTEDSSETRPAPTQPATLEPAPAKIEPVLQPAPAKPAPVKLEPAKPAPAKRVSGPASTGVRATDVYLNHFCLLSDHTNLCSRTTMHPDWPGHSLKLEPMNGTGKTITGTLIIDYDASKIEPAADGHLRHSVRHTTTRFEKSPGRLTLRNVVVEPGKDYQYLWNGIKPGASGTVFGKATLSWRQDGQTKYAIGCYEFNIGSEGGNDNIQGQEKKNFNGFGGMDCGEPSLPE